MELERDMLFLEAKDGPIRDGDEEDAGGATFVVIVAVREDGRDREGEENLGLWPGEENKHAHVTWDNEKRRNMSE